MKVVALVEDLLFESKLRGVAQAVQADIRIARTAAALLEMISADAPHRVLIDLSADGGAGMQLGGELTTAALRPQIIGFLPHVEAGRAREARRAGFDLVLPRSEFVRRLPELLAGAGTDRKHPGE